jgi:nicotinamidase-related amidase
VAIAQSEDELTVTTFLQPTVVPDSQWLQISGRHQMPGPLPRTQSDNALLLVVDVQDGLLKAIHDAESVVEACRRMVAAARLLEIPILVTEQYPKGLGPTCVTVRDALGECEPVTKTRFSACVESIVDELAGQARQMVIVIGIETHVCVQQTVLDLLRLGYRPVVCRDAVGSRRPLDRDVAVQRMRQAGATVTTTESITLEIVGQAGTDVFKAILPIIK